jgi:hypothetical protein
LSPGHYLVQPDTQGQITIAVKNCSPINLKLQCNDFIGSIKNVHDCDYRELNPAYLQAMAKKKEASQPWQNLSAQKGPCIMENVKMQVPEQFSEQYLKVVLHNYEVMSQDKFD